MSIGKHVEAGKADNGAELTSFEMKLSPIVDKRSYDAFIRSLSMGIYLDFERTLKEQAVERPELRIVGLDLTKATTEMETRMADYVALNARLTRERAFVDIDGYVEQYLPRIARESDSKEKLLEYVESRVQRDIAMEIRAIAIQHIPDEERYRYMHKFKE